MHDLLGAQLRARDAGQQLPRIVFAGRISPAVAVWRQAQRLRAAGGIHEGEVIAAHLDEVVALHRPRANYSTKYFATRLPRAEARVKRFLCNKIASKLRFLRSLKTDKAVFFNTCPDNFVTCHP